MRLIKILEGKHEGAVSMDVVREAVHEMAGARIFVDDTPNLSIRAIVKKARQLKASHGIRLMAVDYLQLVSGASKLDSHTLDKLKGAAKKMQMPIIAVTQMRKGFPEKSLQILIRRDE
jgi:replicative DNA helicase